MRLDDDVTTGRDVDSQILEHFEATVAEEWERMESTLEARVSLELHRRMLARHVQRGHRVLEIGSGGGRFTLALAELGATITVTDISPAQLSATRARLTEHELASSVDSFEIVDVRDLSRFEPETFDVVCAFGGPLSYTFERIDDTLAGVADVLRPGGVLVASVMSNAGAARATTARFAGLVDQVGATAIGLVLQTGDLRPIQLSGHTCQMFYADQVVELIGRSPLELGEMSASSWLTTGSPSALEELSGDLDHWAALLEWEASLAARPGCLDGGSHLLFTACRP